MQSSLTCFLTQTITVLITPSTDIDFSWPAYNTALRSLPFSGGSIAIDVYILGFEHSGNLVHSFLLAANFQLSLDGQGPPVPPPLKTNHAIRLG